MNILISYAHFRHGKDRWMGLIKLWRAVGLPVLVDSGAFSIYHSGKTVDHSAYISFCRQLEPLGVEYIQLDKPFDREATRTQLDREYAEGLHSIPVLTANEETSKFPELVAYNPRVCLAGGVTETPALNIARIEDCYRTVGGKCSIHTLGFSNGFEPLKSKTYSVDSTSWLAALKWGSCYLYDDIKGVVPMPYNKLSRRSLDKLPKCARDFIRQSGITPADMRGPEGGRTQRSLISFISAVSWLRYALRYEQVGKRFYFALVVPWMATQLLLSVAHMKRTGMNWKALRQEMPGLMGPLSKGTWASNEKAIRPYFERAATRWQELLDAQG